MSIEIVDYNNLEIDRVSFNDNMVSFSNEKPDFISVKVSLNGFSKYIHIKGEEFDQILGFIKKITLIELSK